MKKIRVVLSIMLVALFAFFAMGSGDDSTTVDQGSGSVSGNQEQGTLGDYSVEIMSCRLAKDYSGKDVVIVKYLFKNVSDDDATAFWIALDDNVYQNGIGLNTAYMVEDDANYSSDNQMKEIKKGASLEVEVAYELNDTTTDIEVEVKELISFNDTVVKKTFSIK